MDAITKAALEVLIQTYPNSIIRLTHQFLDGSDGHPCGFVPVNPCESVVTLPGRWWVDE